MTPLFVKYSHSIILEEHSTDPYGPWYVDYDFEVKSVHLFDPDYPYEELGTVLDLKIGDPVYVLYMIYSSGDSFGSSSGNGEILWTFANHDAAMLALECIKEKDSEWNLEFLDDAGTIIKMSNPAAGYFENLNSVNIFTTKVQA